MAARLAICTAFQLLAEAEAQHIFPPGVEGLFGGAVASVLQDVLQHVAEVAVARGRYGGFEVERGGVGVASELPRPGIVISAVAGISVRRLQHPFLQADQPVDELEHGAGRVGGHHRAVEHRLPRIARQAVVAAAYACQHVHVYSGAGYHGQDFPGRRLYGDHRTHLALHELLAVLLQVCVDGRDYVVSGDGRLVLAPVEICRLQPVPRVPEQDVVAFM